MPQRNFTPPPHEHAFVFSSGGEHSSALQREPDVRQVELVVGYRKTI
jgi:hypothetical protein